LNYNSFDEITQATDVLTGRFVLIYLTNQTINVFHDATGFREVYYYKNQDTFACGSSSNIIARYLNLKPDDDKHLNTFFNSGEFNDYEKKWVGNRTMYKGVTKLLPNHYVALLHGKSFRYWPTKERKCMALKTATEEATNILTGTFSSAVNRFQVHQTLTSGWDTRLLLASARKHTDKLRFYFLRGFKADQGSVGSGDYLISRRMAEDFNLNMHFIQLEDVCVDKEFERIYFTNNVLAREKLLKFYYHQYRQNYTNAVTVSGTIGNSLLRLNTTLDQSIVTPVIIAKKLRYCNFPYAIESISEWFEGAKHLAKENYYLMDLFYWEQYLSNWGALSGSEQDIVMDELRPFNNRELILKLGSVHDKYRYKDYPLNYVKTIEMLWPQLLKYPTDIDNYKIKKALRVVNLEQFMNNVYHKIKA
jgi:asparagine synthetase B (glutamine-hydrolysing)